MTLDRVDGADTLLIKRTLLSNRQRLQQISVGLPSHVIARDHDISHIKKTHKKNKKKQEVLSRSALMRKMHI